MNKHKMAVPKINKSAQAEPKPKRSEIEMQGKYTNFFPALFTVLIITLIAYYPCINNGFTNWDDLGYITENPLLPKNKPLDYFFKDKFVMSNYHPLTMLTYSLEFAWVKLNPKQYHVDNLLLHLLNTALVFWFVFLLAGFWQSAAVAAVLFGIHPMHVESVAWISERKDVLYTFFFLASLIAYLFYFRTGKFKFYWLSLILFVFSLFSKGQAVTLTLVILLIDYFCNRTLNKKALLEKIPFLFLSIVFGVVAYYAQKTAQSVSADTVFFDTIFYASYGLLSYVFRFFLPIQQACIYPYPDKTDGLLPLLFYLAPVVIILLTILILKKWRTNKIVVFGVLFFILNIAPVLQFIQVGHSITSDRYTYIPYIGLFFIAGQLWIYFSGNENFNAIGKNVKKTSSLFGNGKNYFILLLLIIAGFAYAGNQRCKVWKNSETLWNDELESFPGNADAYNGLGLYYTQQGELFFKKENSESAINYLDKAIENYNRSLALNPYKSIPWSNKIMAQIKKGQVDSALKTIDRAMIYVPDDYELYNWRASIYADKEMYREAISDLLHVIKTNPVHPWAYDNLGQGYAQLQQYDSAVFYFNKMLYLHPGNTETYIERGNVWQMKKEYFKAVNDFTEALKHDPNNAQVYYMRSSSYIELNDKKAALRDALKAKELGMSIPDEYWNKLNN